MRPPRSAPRINLRFSDLEEMDQIELLANQDGLDLQNWIRRLIRNEARNRRIKQLILVLVLKSIFKIMFMVESLVGKDQQRIAEERADLKFDQLKIDAEHF